MTATSSAPSSAAGTGSLPQSARSSPGAPVSARCDGGTGQIKGRFPDGFLADRWTVGGSRGHFGRRFDAARTEAIASCRDWIGSALLKGEEPCRYTLRQPILI